MMKSLTIATIAIGCQAVELSFGVEGYMGSSLPPKGGMHKSMPRLGDWSGGSSRGGKPTNVGGMTDLGSKADPSFKPCISGKPSTSEAGAGPITGGMSNTASTPGMTGTLQQQSQ